MSKDRNKSLENIANSFRAAYKIQNIMDTSVHSDGNRSSMRIQPDLLKDILQVIAEYSPARYRVGISSSLNQSVMYTDTYRSLRQHIKNANTRGTRSDDIVDVMKIVKPVLPDRNQTVIEKLLKVYEILKS